MDQPDGFIANGQENKGYKLFKSLDGLKQAPKQWHEKFDNTLTSVGFIVNEATNVRTIDMVGVKVSYYAYMLMTF
jgi:hypothetical protein